MDDKIFSESKALKESPRIHLASDELCIRMENVKKEYTVADVHVRALQGVSFQVRQGEYITIMGPSGSGKSTLMNMIGCLDRPSSGVVEIGGKNTAAMSEKELAFLRNKTVGFVFQQYFLLSSMSILENVMLPLRYQGIHRKDARQRAEAALVDMGLQDRLHHTPAELSGGQKQRAAIARATVTRPQIILADEPTGALDSTTGKLVLELFSKINRQGTTVIIVTHDPKIGAQAPRQISILDGKIIQDTASSGAADQAGNPITESQRAHKNGAQEDSAQENPSEIINLGEPPAPESSQPHPSGGQR